MIELPISHWLVALIDDKDLRLVATLPWQAHRTKCGTHYAVLVRTRGGVVVERVSMHRLITGAASDELVDHRDGNGLNNCRSNLRPCNRRQNAQNRALYTAKKRARGGFIGVSRHAQSGLWLASIHAGVIQSNGERARISLKYHATAEAAARVRDSAAAYYFAEFAALNFPNESPDPFDLALVRGSSALTERERIEIQQANGRRLLRLGSEHGMAKLNESAVARIRESNEPAVVLAGELGVTAKTIRLVRSGKAGMHVSTEAAKLPFPIRGMIDRTGNNRYRLRFGPDRTRIGMFDSREEAEAERSKMQGVSGATFERVRSRL